MSRTFTNFATMLRRLLVHRRLPVALAVAAVVVMLPALWGGLVGDDVIQGLTQFKHTELPPRVLDTGFVSPDSGKLSTVLCGLFGYPQGEREAVRARDYGIAPWWANEHWQARLFRPLTAFTHWLDYRLYPEGPALMHAHSILWYSAAVFLVAMLYRRMAGFQLDGGAAGNVAEPRPASGAHPALLAAGMAACLFLLDKNTYFPVMYVANRGFIVALVFGLLGLHAHILWRTTRALAWMCMSTVCLLLSLLSNEGGASTLAFLTAYALVIEQGGWRSRLVSLLPAAGVVLGWRAIYSGSGFGVRNFVLYIDPGYSPLLFLKNLPERAIGLVGGQLTGLPPEIALGLNSKWQLMLTLLFFLFTLFCAVAFLPVIRRDRVARFWSAVMLLAAIPAATVF